LPVADIFMRLVAHFFVFILGILMILFRFLTGQAVGFKPDPDGNCRLVYRIFPPPSTLRKAVSILQNYLRLFRTVISFPEITRDVMMRFVIRFVPLNNLIFNISTKQCKNTESLQISQFKTRECPCVEAGVGECPCVEAEAGCEGECPRVEVILVQRHDSAQDGGFRGNLRHRRREVTAIHLGERRTE
jgi:hypothetical protein